MKIAFSTLGCPNWDLNSIVKNAVKFGYDAVELRGIMGVTDPEKIPEFSDDNISNTKKAFDDNNINVCVVGSSACLHDKEKKQEYLKDAFKTVDIASKLGAEYIRVFGNNIPKNQNEHDVIAFASLGIAEICDYAKDKGVSVLLEVHGDFNIAERLLEVEKRVGRENFGLIWDVAHSDVVYLENFSEFYEKVGHLVRHVHLKDHIRLEDNKTRLCSFGEGDIPLGGIVKLLSANGFSGILSYENEKLWHKDLDEPEFAFSHYSDWIKSRI